MDTTDRMQNHEKASTNKLEIQGKLRLKCCNGKVIKPVFDKRQIVCVCVVLCRGERHQLIRIMYTICLFSTVLSGKAL